MATTNSATPWPEGPDHSDWRTVRVSQKILGQVQGPLTLGNVVSYINAQLSAEGFSTRFQKVQKGGTAAITVFSGRASLSTAAIASWCVGSNGSPSASPWLAITRA